MCGIVDKMKILLTLFLVACQQERIFPVTHITVSSVDVTWKPIYTQLQSDLKALGDDILRDGPDGLAIVVDGPLAAMNNARGIYQPEHKRIVLMPLETWVDYGDKQIYLTAPFAMVVLAHEVGHAMGLAHSATGLMSVKDADLTQCIDRAAECLIEALDGR